MRRQKNSPDDILRVRLIMAAVALEFHVRDMDLTKPGRGSPQMVLARQVAMYLTITVFHLTQSRTAGIFRRDRSTIYHACKIVEEHRDDPIFDVKISRLESFLHQAPMPVAA